MGIKFLCPNGHKLHVKSFLAGHCGICPRCGERFLIPSESLPNIRVEPVSAAASVAEPAEVAAMAADAALPAAISGEPAVRSGSDSSIRMMGATLLAPAAQPRAAAEASASTTSSESRRVVDPLAEAPQAIWYLRLASGDQYGPARADVMGRWIDEGRVPAEGFVWREGWPDWRRAGAAFPELLEAESIPEIPPPRASDSPATGVRGGEPSRAGDRRWLASPATNSAEPSPLKVEPSMPAAPAVGISRFVARRQSRQTRLIAMIALIALVVVLLPLFVFVLLRQ